MTSIHPSLEKCAARGGLRPAPSTGSSRPTESAPRLRSFPLVSSPISQTFLELYPKSVRVKRPFSGPTPEPPTRQDTEIKGFSKKSRARLRFTAANSDHKIKIQFCMTYGDVWPINGRSLKADLNRFLASVKKSFPNLEYLWIAEFQTRGCPHFHFFSNIPLSIQNHETLTRKWHKIAGYGQEDKKYQKSIPAGFLSFGRWWGNSRSLVPDPDTVDSETISEKFDCQSALKNDPTSASNFDPPQRVSFGRFSWS